MPGYGRAGDAAADDDDASRGRKQRRGAQMGNGGVGGILPVALAWIREGAGDGDASAFVHFCWGESGLGSSAVEISDERVRLYFCGSWAGWKLRPLTFRFRWSEWEKVEVESALGWAAWVR